MAKAIILKELIPNSLEENELPVFQETYIPYAFDENDNNIEIVTMDASELGFNIVEVGN